MSKNNSHTSKIKDKYIYQILHVQASVIRVRLIIEDKCRLILLMGFSFDKGRTNQILDDKFFLLTLPTFKLISPP